MPKFIFSRKKTNFSFLGLITLLIIIVSITFGSVDSFASNNQQEKTFAVNFVSEELISSIAENKRFNLFTNNTKSLFSRNNAIPSIKTKNSLTNSNSNDLASTSTFVVTRTDDRNETCNSGVDCSLREAITAANISANEDTISFKEGFGENVSLNSGELLITSNITITGLATNRITISRISENHFRIFNVSAGATVSINNLSISGGLLPRGDSGGGIYNAGTLNLNNVIVSGNILFTTLGFSAIGGGGIHNLGTLNIFNSRISNNQGSQGGGIYNSGNLSLSNSEVTGNSTGTGDGYGAGIYNSGTLEIAYSSVSENRVTAPAGLHGGAGSGGGIAGSVTLLNSKVVGNSVSARYSKGGGISGKVTAINSTISGNNARGAVISGGGIFGETILQNSTVSNNGVTSNYTPSIGEVSGGGISGKVTATNSTISYNYGGGISGGVGSIFGGGGVANLKNTIVSNNSGLGTNGFNDISGEVISQGYNLIGNSACSNCWVSTDLVNVDTKLAPLGDNGGPTQTHALLNGSPAIDAGNNEGAPDADQRGFARITDGNGDGSAIIDIGAYETARAVIPNTPSINSISPTNLAVGSEAFDLYVYGNSFTNTSIVRWNGQDRTTTFISSTQLKARILSTDLQTPGQNPITVFNPSETGGTSNAITFTVDCTYSLTPASHSFPVIGGSGVINVTTQPGCAWEAVKKLGVAISPSLDWVTITSGSGVGNGVIHFSVGSNTNNFGGSRTRRSAYIGVTGENGVLSQNDVAIYQDPNCYTTLNPASVNVSPSGGSGFISYSSPTGCGPSGYSISHSWITYSFTGSYSIAANNGPARTGTITLIGDSNTATFTINQDSGCTYSLSITSATIPASGAIGSFGITTSNAACTWTVQSNVPWITVTSNNSNTGNATVSYTVAANTGQSRTGTITAGGQTYTVNQAAGSVDCSYSLSAANSAFDQTGGTGTINVTTDADCSWSAISNVPWITTSAGGGNNGSGTVTFSVAANTGLDRTGTITIAGQTFIITQTAGCSYTLSRYESEIFPDSGGTGSFTVITAANCSWTAVSNAPWITITSGNNGTGNGTVSYSVAPNSETSGIRVWSITAGGQTYTVSQGGSGDVIGKPHIDFDGDGKTDVSVYRPSDGVWHLQRSRDGYTSVQFGTATDKLVPADYDGDLKTDVAVFREDPNNPNFAYYYILNSRDNTVRAVQFGSTGDIPVEGDWDGDYKFDIGVYRPGTAANPQGHFYYRPSSQPNTNFISFPWGNSGDKPVAADYDRDGKTDPAVFRPSTGVWYIQRSTEGFYAIQFGAAEDKPVVGDYDGDRKADQAVFRPSNGVWYIWNSRDGFSAAQFGISTDKPVPGDYDGDGKNDLAVYRDDTWFILSSISGFTTIGFGTATDKPVPNAFVP